MGVVKRALITGIGGQDGRYLAQLLSKKGYEVHGTVRDLSSYKSERFLELKDAHIHQMDVRSDVEVSRAIELSNPHELYHLASPSFIPFSWENPLEVAQSTALGVTRVLEEARKRNKPIRIFFASSQEIYGTPLESPQREETPFAPNSPYGISKLYGHLMVMSYRKNFGMHASNGILFNHESPLRPIDFVTRKITHTLAKIKLGMQECLELGNLNAKRDWGYAGDYVEAMWLMLQQDTPDDYVIATGKSHSVREAVEFAFNAAGMNLSWEGEGRKERGVCEGKTVVKINESLYRPSDCDLVVGDYGKAKKKLGWVPKKTFEETMRIMIDYDIAQLRDLHRKI